MPPAGKMWCRSSEPESGGYHRKVALAMTVVPNAAALVPASS